jgi:adenine-specific DNA-methyltransferase
MLEEIKQQLGTPTYSCDGVLLYEGDCCALMHRLNKTKIQLTVTSPPYNIGKAYEEVREIDAYLEWCHAWIRDIWAITSSTGSFWLNVGYVSYPGKAGALPIPYLLWDKIPFYLIQEIVWNYGAGVACRRSFSPRNEKFLWYVKNQTDYVFNLDAVRDPNVKYPNQKKNGKLKCNPIGKNPTDVWQFPKVTSGTNRASKERTPHPAQFPVAVIERIIKACSNPGDVIFDPFMGSGSTAEAALRCGRSVVGFEVRGDYVKLAGERLEKYWSQRRLDEAQGKLF